VVRFHPEMEACLVKIKIPISSGIGLVMAVSLTCLLLWPLHTRLMSARNEEPARVDFAPLRKSTRFPRSSHHLYDSEPASSPTPSPPEVRWADREENRVTLPSDLATEVVLERKIR
jgi:hypothetical protein